MDFNKFLFSNTGPWIEAWNILAVNVNKFFYPNNHGKRPLFYHFLYIGRTAYDFPKQPHREIDVDGHKPSQ